MNILTKQAIKEIEKVKLPCKVEITVLPPKDSKWQRILCRLLDYEMRVRVTIVSPHGKDTLCAPRTWPMVAGDKVTLYDLYTGLKIDMPEKAR